MLTALPVGRQEHYVSGIISMEEGSYLGARTLAQLWNDELWAQESWRASPTNSWNPELWAHPEHQSLRSFNSDPERNGVSYSKALASASRQDIWDICGQILLDRSK